MVILLEIYKILCAQPAARTKEEIPETDHIHEDEFSTSDGEEDYRNPLQNDDFNYDDYVQDDETPDYRFGSNPTQDETYRIYP